MAHAPFVSPPRSLPTSSSTVRKVCKKFETRSHYTTGDEGRGEDSRVQREHHALMLAWVAHIGGEGERRKQREEGDGAHASCFVAQEQVC